MHDTPDTCMLPKNHVRGDRPKNGRDGLFLSLLAFEIFHVRKNTLTQNRYCLDLRAALLLEDRVLNSFSIGCWNLPDVLRRRRALLNLTTCSREEAGIKE